MANSNKHLTEVICGFQFIQNPTVWDSTYFGQFYERIKTHGFTQKEERKGLQVEINANPADLSNPKITAEQTPSDLVIFKNPVKGWAISIGSAKISFHIIKDYTKWEDFRTLLIIPFYKLYKDMGLGDGPRQCAVMYLNKFIKPDVDNLADYFTIINPLNAEFGAESNTFVQRVFRNKQNILITKLNFLKTPESNNNNINFECGAISDFTDSIDIIKQADETHAPIQAFFEAIITNKLKENL